MTKELSIIASGPFAIFSQGGLNIERVSYPVLTVPAAAGLLKSVYWKPAIEYKVKEIVVYNPIRYLSVKKNEVADKISWRFAENAVNSSCAFYTQDHSAQHNTVLLKDVRYGIRFEIVLTGRGMERDLETMSEDAVLEKHYRIMKRRLENGECFRTPCFGQSECIAENIQLVDAFDLNNVCREYRDTTVDFGKMPYETEYGNFGPCGQARWTYYHPVMVNGSIDVEAGVERYRTSPGSSLLESLCRYYDRLAGNGEILPAEYTDMKIHYIAVLSPGGQLKDVLDIWQYAEAAGLPKPPEKPGFLSMVFPSFPLPTSAYKPRLLEQRGKYIFGLDAGNEAYGISGRTFDAWKVYRDYNVKLLRDAGSECVKGFVEFLQNWNPEDETGNDMLLRVLPKFGLSNFAFAVQTEGGLQLVNEDPELKALWEEEYPRAAAEKNEICGECAVLGKELPLARLHPKVKLRGCTAGGGSLVSYNDTCGESGGSVQSYRANISKIAAEKYTTALNYLLSEPDHHMYLNDTCLVWWPDDVSAEDDPLYGELLVASTTDVGRGAEQLAAGHSNLMKAIRDGDPEKAAQIVKESCEDTVYKVLQLKPASGRISIVSVREEALSELVMHLAIHNQNTAFDGRESAVTTWQLKQVLTADGKDNTLSPRFLQDYMDAVCFGGDYPKTILSMALGRVWRGDKPNRILGGLIRAAINQKEEGKMPECFDAECTDIGYLLGRSFAVIEAAQDASSEHELNRTIRDSYFQIASRYPEKIMGSLMTKFNYYLSKLRRNDEKRGLGHYYDRMYREITDKISGFPKRLTEEESGAFILGYMHQRTYMYTKKEEQ